MTAAVASYDPPELQSQGLGLYLAPEPEPPPQSPRPTRTSTAELKTRAELTARLLATGRRKGEVKRMLKQRFGVSARACERYLSAARNLLIAWTGKSREDHFVDAFAFYWSVISDPDPAVTLRTRMQARRQLDRLLGLEPPRPRTGWYPRRWPRRRRARPAEGV